MTKIAPSDFAYIHRNCPRCSALRLRHGTKLPAGPFPPLFSALDREWRATFGGKDTRDHPEFAGIPGGRLVTNAARLTAKGSLNGLPYTIQGLPDALIEQDDGTYGVLDLKVSSSKLEYMAKNYAPQLHAYALGLTQSGKRVSWLGLMAARITLTRPVTYESVQIAYEPARFEVYLSGLLERTVGPLPESDPECPYCTYRTAPINHGPADPAALLYSTATPKAQAKAKAKAKPETRVRATKADPESPRPARRAFIGGRDN